jgi:hypothetical protein
MIKLRQIRLHRPRKSRQSLIGAAILALGLATAVNGFAHPQTQPQEFAAFSNTGAFSYSAQTTRPDPLVYPSGVAQTGDPLVLGDIDQMTVHFSYRFHSRLQHSLRGTILFQVVFIGESGWRNAEKLVKPSAFTGDGAVTTATLSLSGLGKVLAKLQAGSDVAARAYTVYLQPVVRYEGTVGNRQVHGTFSPTLPFTLDAAVFAPKALNLQDPSSQGQRLAAELQPTQTGRMHRSVANVISFIGLSGPALAFRVGGCLLAALGLLIALTSQRRRRDDIWTHERRVAHRAGRALVDVLNLEQTLPPGSTMTQVASFDSLVALAVQTERPILREALADAELFAVEVAPRLFVWRQPVGGPSRVPPTIIAGEQVPDADDRKPAGAASTPSGRRHLALHGKRRT